MRYLIVKYGNRHIQKEYISSKYAVLSDVDKCTIIILKQRIFNWIWIL